MDSGILNYNSQKPRLREWRLGGVSAPQGRWERRHGYTGRAPLESRLGAATVCPNLCGPPRRIAGPRGQGQGPLREEWLTGKDGPGPELSPRSGGENGIQWKQRGPLPGICCLVRSLACTVSFGPQGQIYLLQARHTVQGVAIKPFKIFCTPSLCLYLLNVFLAQLQQCWPLHFLQ